MIIIVFWMMHRLLLLIKHKLQIPLKESFFGWDRTLSNWFEYWRDILLFSSTHDFCTIWYFFRSIAVYYLKRTNAPKWFWMNCLANVEIIWTRVFSFIIISTHYFIIHYVILIITQQANVLNWACIKNSCDGQDVL